MYYRDKEKAITAENKRQLSGHCSRFIMNVLYPKEKLAQGMVTNASIKIGGKYRKMDERIYQQLKNKKITQKEHNEMSSQHNKDYQKEIAPVVEMYSKDAGIYARKKNEIDKEEEIFRKLLFNTKWRKKAHKRVYSYMRGYLGVAPNHKRQACLYIGDK
jgi:DNA-directed RNA polymerase subunit M/transcription elongation factor TFIIS